MACTGFIPIKNSAINNSDINVFFHFFLLILGINQNIWIIPLLLFTYFHKQFSCALEKHDKTVMSLSS